MTDENNGNQDDIELAYASLAVFADDGTLDQHELDALLHIALRDGQVSESQRAVLKGVFNRVLEPDVPADVWARIQSIREQHGI